jgi:hypothetical protein
MSSASAYRDYRKSRPIADTKRRRRWLFAFGVIGVILFWPLLLKLVTGAFGLAVGLVAGGVGLLAGLIGALVAGLVLLAIFGGWILLGLLGLWIISALLD